MVQTKDVMEQEHRSVLRRATTDAGVLGECRAIVEPYQRLETRIGIEEERPDAQGNLYRRARAVVVDCDRAGVPARRRVFWDMDIHEEHHVLAGCDVAHRG